MELLTREQAAVYLGVSVDTVRRWVKEGRLTPVRLGPRTVRLRLDELQVLIDDQSRPAAG